MGSKPRQHLSRHAERAGELGHEGGGPGAGGDDQRIDREAATVGGDLDAVGRSSPLEHPLVAADGRPEGRSDGELRRDRFLGKQHARGGFVKAHLVVTQKELRIAIRDHGAGEHLVSESVRHRTLT